MKWRYIAKCGVSSEIKICSFFWQESRGTLLEEKMRKKVLNDAKADNYAEELSKLQSKLDKLGFRPEVKTSPLPPTAQTNLPCRSSNVTCLT